MPRLTHEEIMTFLREPGHLLRVATVDDDGYPRLVPTYFMLDGNDIFFTPRVTSRFLENIRRDARVCLSIDEDGWPWRKVTVQGKARVQYEPGQDDAWRDFYRTITVRYISEDLADAYMPFLADQPRALLAVSLDGSRVTTWRMPVGDEDPTGVWARHHYLPGTLMAGRAKRRGRQA